MFILSSSSLAQSRLPFTGTRTFCGEDYEGKATITIRKDGFTRVKSDMSLDEAYPFAFSGMLNAKGILRRERGRYLEIKSATAIRMHDGGTWIDGKLCSAVLPKESNDVQRTPDDEIAGVGQLPFTGTRTFCGIDFDKGLTTVVSIRKGGFTTVKTNIWTEDPARYVTFSGKLNAKGILRRNRDIYLQVKSGSDILMVGAQDHYKGELCKQ